MLRAGFIGAGPRARSAHYPSVSRLPAVSMEAVCEMDEERLAHITSRHSFPHVFRDHREMLERVELDVVYCVMNEKWLLQPALDCLSAGKHLFIEKPPGKNSEETRQLLAAAEKADVHLMVGLQRRYAAVVEESRRRVSEKGPVTLVTTSFHKQMLGGKGDEVTTTLWNDLIHVVDLTRYLAGGEAADVTAYRAGFASDSRNFYTAMVRFDRAGATGVILGNRASGGRVLRAELHGVGIGCYMKIPEEVEVLEDNERQLINGWELTDSPPDDELVYEGTLAMHEHFIECIHSGQRPLTDIRDVVHTVDLVDEIEGPLD